VGSTKRWHPPPLRSRRSNAPPRAPRTTRIVPRAAQPAPSLTDGSPQSPAGATWRRPCDCRCASRRGTRRRAGNRATVDAAAFSLRHSFSSCASISFIELDVLIRSCMSSSAMTSDAAHSRFCAAGGSLAPCGGSPEAALSRRKLLRRPWLRT
jgi:hypothetical protein